MPGTKFLRRPVLEVDNRVRKGRFEMRTVLWIGIPIIVVAYAACALLTVDRRSDEVVITSLINDAAAAAGDCDVGGVIYCVSKNYKDESGNNYYKLRQLAAQVMRSDVDYTVHTDIGRLRINGDRATVELYAKVAEANGGGVLYERHLTLLLRKEGGRHALIVPVKVWRVTNVENLGLE